MRLDLIEVEQKPSKFKIISYTVIIILILSIPLMFVIKHFDNKRMLNEKDNNVENIESNIVNNIEDIENIEESNIKEEKTLEKEKINLPVMTKKGIENFENIYHSEEKRAFLTFDDGPSKTVTPLILDILKGENVKASFFVLGSRVELYPELVKREFEEGHYIANHGYSHVYSQIYSSVEAVLDEYYSAENAIRDALGNPEYNSYVFRFPGGSNGGRYDNLKSEAKLALEQNNIAFVDWNSLTGDATGQGLTKDQMFEEMVNTSNGKDSLVILMHDAGDKEETAEMLPGIINYLREQGYTFKNFYSIIE